MPDTNLPSILSTDRVDSDCVLVELSDGTTVFLSVEQVLGLEPVIPLPSTGSKSG